jgi:hypothetical protein
LLCKCEALSANQKKKKRVVEAFQGPKLRKREEFLPVLSVVLGLGTQGLKLAGQALKP